MNGTAMPSTWWKALGISEYFLKQLKYVFYYWRYLSPILSFFRARINAFKEASYLMGPTLYLVVYIWILANNKVLLAFLKK